MRARRNSRRGFKAIRFFPAGQNNKDIFEPRESIGPTARMLNKAREVLGDDLVLGIDYHHRLSVAEAASFCAKLDRGVLDFLEEPIRDETPEAYESLRRMTDIPFAIGEEFASKWQFLPYIERDIHQFNRLDVCNVGGLTEAMKVAGWSEAHYVDLMPHNPLGPVCTAATVHLGAAVPNFAWLETRAPEAKLGFDNAEYFPVQPATRRRRLSRERPAGPRRRGERGGDQRREPALLGSSAPAPPRRLRDQLVGQRKTTP